MYLIIAGALEIIWASSLKHGGIPVIIALITSFDLLIKTVKVVPIGTAYAVFAGIGTIGTVIVEIVMFGGEISLLKIGII
ncbi:DMT family transporter [Lederbergia galactosidilytica]|uniref:DMT family transporter n=1 Tax=Lederbergia galactosidilytica TaxID=217031 RepID=UPI0009EDB7A0|nr:SMR family transporter [Lederbergia galactosidilytica]